MTSAATEKTSTSAIVTPSGQATGVSNALRTSLGRTEIADTVVSKIAGLAAGAVPGVYKLGGGAARAFGAIRERIPGASTNAGQGVTVEVGQTQAAVDLDLVVEYGTPIVELARSVRRNVITALEGMTGLQVVEVNITVNDVHLPSDDDADDHTESRVQ